MQWIVLGCLVSVLMGAGLSSVPPDIKAWYDQKEYQKVLDGLSALSQDAQVLPDVRRLKARTLVKLGKPQEALAEYDKLETGLGQDDVPLLRQVALGFILVLLKDMREQMRGAAYTALKEIDSDEVVPYFEDGLSDGSGPRSGCGRIGTLGRRPKIQEAATCVGGPGGSGQSTGRESARKERRPVGAPAH
jgi:hypothetical protein